MSSIIDTHCHLDLDAFDDDRDEVVRRAVEAGIHAMLLIGYNPQRWRTTREMSQRWPFLRRAAGIHPNDACLWSGEMEGRLREEVEATSPVAIGEIGVDLFRSSENRDQQIEAFERQLAVARELDLPVIIHQRAAEDDVLAVLERNTPVRGVMHCFTGDVAFSHRCLDLGMYLGVGGVITYPKSGEVRAAVAAAPLERLLLETDAPFLAPQSRRGARNEPALLPDVAQVIADLKHVSRDDIGTQTTANAIDLFGPSLGDALRTGMEHV